MIGLGHENLEFSNRAIRELQIFVPDLLLFLSKRF